MNDDKTETKGLQPIVKYVILIAGAVIALVLIYWMLTHLSSFDHAI